MVDFIASIDWLRSSISITIDGAARGDAKSNPAGRALGQHAQGIGDEPRQATPRDARQHGEQCDRSVCRLIRRAAPELVVG
jgi:hypothetical protein